MSLALIDGDIIAFRAAAGAAQTYFAGDEPVGNEAVAKENAIEAVDAWRKIAGCKHAVVCFTGQHNFRKHILPSYKASRGGKGKPPCYWATVDSVKDRFPTQTVDGLEADDLLGILSTTDKYRDQAIVLSQDKDLRTIPGRFMNPLKDRRPYLISEAEADHWWLTQTLTGDSTDEYKGVPGIGPKKAAVILGATAPRQAVPLEHSWAKVVAAFRGAKLPESEALLQARCARILRRQDYDKERKEIRLWHLTNPESLSLATVCGV